MTRSFLSSGFVFILAITLLSSLACTSKPDDVKISGAVQSKFGQDSGLSAKQLTVQASNGVVTLAGFVDNDAQREAASRQAASVEGVREVVNNLQVGSASNVSKPNSSVATAAGQVTPPDNAAPNRKSHRSKAPEKEAAEKNPAAEDHPYTVADRSQPASPPPQGASSTDAPPPPPPPQPHKVTIEQGTQFSIRLVDSIDSEKNQTGDTFHATLNAPLTAEGAEAIPAGTDVAGHIVDLRSAGKFKGQSLVVLQLDSITANGKTYNLQTDQYRKEGSSRGKNTAEKVGGGAIIGGIIGAIAGGGKGAAIGSAAGAGVGGGAQAATKGQQIKLPSETVLNFTLQAPVTVIKPPDPNAGRQRLGDSQ